ncbi:MAG: hypothetical protein E7013_03040 [Alphaproteobacteria bacterium]|nr:hypothetical protein [Alphaproteobacteria bacterium]
MKVLLISLFLFLIASVKVFANPACPVCTVAIVSGLTIAQKLGVDACIVALWAGAMLAMLGYWMIRFLDKRKWTFKGYKLFSMILCLSMLLAVYVKDLTYTPNVILGFLYMDCFLFTGLLGAFVLIFGVNFYAWMKAKNGGHAHFPFEKVVVPIALLALINLVLVYHPLCDCNETLSDKPNVVSMDDMPSFD